MIEKPPKARCYATSGRRLKGNGRDPVKAKACRDRFHKKHPDAARKYHLKRLYRLTPEQVAVMDKAQGGRCALCHERYGKPNIDLDHATGEARGLLCRECNLALGLLEKLGRERVELMFLYVEEESARRTPGPTQP